MEDCPTLTGVGQELALRQPEIGELFRFSTLIWLHFETFGQDFFFRALLRVDQKSAENVSVVFVRILPSRKHMTVTPQSYSEATIRSRTLMSEACAVCKWPKLRFEYIWRRWANLLYESLLSECRFDWFVDLGQMSKPLFALPPPIAWPGFAMRIPEQEISASHDDDLL